MGTQKKSPPFLKESGGDFFCRSCFFGLHFPLLERAVNHLQADAVVCPAYQPCAAYAHVVGYAHDIVAVVFVCLNRYEHHFVPILMALCPCFRCEAGFCGFRVLFPAAVGNQVADVGERVGVVTVVEGRDERSPVVRHPPFFEERIHVLLAHHQEGLWNAECLGLVRFGIVAVQRDNRIYVQVCTRLPEESDREVTNLLEIKDHYPKYVVTLDELATGNVNGVKIIHLADFLLRNEY